MGDGSYFVASGYYCYWQMKKRKVTLKCEKKIVKPISQTIPNEIQKYTNLKHYICILFFF